MYEYISTMDSPDGSFDWERGVCARAVELWSEGREGSATLTEDRRDSSSQRWENRMGWNEFGRDEAPGWRLLSSLPSCPNHHMRFPMSRHLLALQHTKSVLAGQVSGVPRHTEH